MTASIDKLIGRLGLAAAVACCAAASGDELFAPPALAGAGPEPVRVARTCGVGSGFQPVPGRFGALPPAPLAAHPYSHAVSEQAPAKKPALPEVEHHTPCIDARAAHALCDTGDFSADAFFAPYDPCAERCVYGGKTEVDPQRPLIEWGIPWYGAGPLPPSSEILGATNLVQPRFYLHGDYRVGFTQADLVDRHETVLAHRLNLELDYWITATERIHAFVGPFQEGADFMRVVNGEFFNELDLFQADTDTLFFEGDLGQLLGGLRGTYAQFDLPVSAGLIPVLFQNGVWAFDTAIGVAATLPARNSPALDWSNFDVTFFALLDRVSSGAFGFDEDPGAIYGATTFIESRGGYFEIGYGFVDDQDGGGFGYHNFGASYTRRYANALSNSVRVIVNAGQDPHGGERQTADGVLLLVENSLITRNPYNVVPYMNFFAGFDRPQPLARAAAVGGVLFNTGILFQPDALTSYPTLDATGNNTAGVALGVDLLAPGFDQQILLEVAAVHAFDDAANRGAAGDQVGVGMRWQKRLSTETLIRADTMIGRLDNSDNVAGARVEYRWKF